VTERVGERARARPTMAVAIHSQTFPS